MKKMIKGSVLFLAVLAGLPVLPEAGAAALPVSIGTHPVGSVFNTLGTAAAKVISEHTGIRAIPKPMAGPPAWLPYLERGDVELGVLNSWDAENGYLGESIYSRLSNNKGFSVRLLAVSVPNAVGIVVAKDSGIRSVMDLKGKRETGRFPTPSLQLQTEALLANGGLKPTDVTTIPVNSVVEGVKMVIDGRAEGSSVAVGTPVVEELNVKKGARFLTINTDPAAIARTNKIYPGYPMKVTPGPNSTGIEKEGYLWAYDIYLIVKDTVPDQVVYDITKALYENSKEFESVHKSLKDWTQSRFVSREALIPYHAGAVKYYAEKGIWTKEMAKLQDDLLKKKKK